MKHFRKERMESLVREELARMVAQELEFKGMLVTVTSVEAHDDLDEAAVKISVLPSERAEDALKIARAFERRFHGFLIKKLSIRPVPHLRFVIDHGPEKAAEIEKKLIENSPTGDLP